MKINFENKNVLFIDIDDVLVTTKQYVTNKKKWHPEYECYRFDDKCVKVFNYICDIIDPIIILSSDWKNHYNIKMMNEIFKWNNIPYIISDFTPDLWGIKFKKAQDLEECRANEILDFVKENNIKKYVAIDDLNLEPWLEDNFVLIPRANEGIKQSGIKEKIINKFKIQL